MINWIKKNKLATFFGVLFIGSLIFSYFQYAGKREIYKEKTAYEILVQQNIQEIDTLKKQLAIKDVKLAALLKSKAAEKDVQEKIVIKYQKVYETIRNSNDTAQLGILYALLAKHKGLPFKRN